MTPRALSGLLALTLVLPACGAQESAAPAGTIAVVASTDVYGAVVQAVGGDRVSITSLVDDPSADPHSYEAPPAAAAAVAHARLVVVNGGGYDDFAEQLATAPDAKVIDVVALSGLTAPPGGELNEHVWYSLPTVEKLADRLAADLAAADPAGAATYTANATAFKGRVDGLIDKLDAIKAAHAGDKVAITEPVPLYTVQDAGLENITPDEFSEAVEEGNDPPAAVLNETLQLFTTKTVKVLLANTQTESPSTKQVEQAATTAGIPVVAVTETLPAGVDDYVTWQTQQIDQLSTALGTPAS